MPVATGPESLFLSDPSVAESTEYRALVDELRRNFSIEFAIWDGESGELLRIGQSVPKLQTMTAEELVRAVASDHMAQFIADVDGILALALPVQISVDRCFV
ncbi:MAG TPA: hypothetical protein P5307_24805, partial [Pirellulaceae bacterium]|nr:hypothetical protein [Pirellulaceae bacterium]